ncbi:MAG: hypothetical protein DRP64_13475 [Verrucomicrobia bacterium]|nr:MAG: hypothetical protein DRP64_13475 [Verrucomicrobiota bacterium]
MNRISILFILHEEQETTGMQAIYGAHSLKATCGASVVIEQDSIWPHPVNPVDPVKKTEIELLP